MWKNELRDKKQELKKPASLSPYIGQSVPYQLSWDNQIFVIPSSTNARAQCF